MAFLRILRSVLNFSLLILLAAGLLSVSCAEESPPWIAIRLELGEYSGGALVPEGTLLVDDDLVGMAVFVPGDLRELDGNATAQLVKFERRRKQSAPNTELPRLLPLEDFEAVARADDGALFFLGAHEGKDGNRRTSREFLIECKWEYDSAALTGELKLEKEYYVLIDDLRNQAVRGDFTNSEVADLFASSTSLRISEEINFEGLAIVGETIYVGARLPIIEGKTILLSALRREVLGRTSQPPKWNLELLDLDGSGIRGLDSRNGELIVLATNEKSKQTSLWTFDPVSRSATRCRELQSTEFHGAAEGIIALGAGKLAILGDVKKGETAGLGIVEQGCP